MKEGSGSVDVLSNDSSEGLFTFPLPKIDIAEGKDEHLGDCRLTDSNLAKPLFDAGLRVLVLMQRIGWVRSVNNTFASGEHFFTLHLQGECGVLQNGKIHWMKPGELAYNPPDKPFFLTQSSDCSVGRWVYFSIYDTPFWEALKKRGNYVRDCKFADLLFLLVRRILDAKQFHDQEHRLSAKDDSIRLLGLFQEELRRAAKRQNRSVSKLKMLVQSIRIDPSAEWNIGDMAASLNISRRTLTRAFQKEYGLSPIKLVILERVALAETYLTSSDMTIEAIASHVGYRCYHTFSRLFLEHTGLRPGAYRNKWRIGEP